MVAAHLEQLDKVVSRLQQSISNQRSHFFYYRRRFKCGSIVL